MIVIDPKNEWAQSCARNSRIAWRVHYFFLAVSVLLFLLASLTTTRPMGLISIESFVPSMIAGVAVVLTGAVALLANFRARPAVKWHAIIYVNRATVRYFSEQMAERGLELTSSEFDEKLYGYMYARVNGASKAGMAFLDAL